MSEPDMDETYDEVEDGDRICEVCEDEDCDCSCELEEDGVE